MPGEAEQHRTAILHLLDRARSTLKAVLNAVRRFEDVAQKTRAPIFRVQAWRKEDPRLRELQESLNTIKCNLNVLLAASTSQHMTRIRVDLTQLSTITSHTLQEQEARHQEMQREIATIVDQGLAEMKELMQEHTEQLRANQILQIGHRYQQCRRSPSPETASASLLKDMVAPVRIQVSQRNSCRPGCICQCHTESRTSTPNVIDRVLGQLFLGYSGLPASNAKCNQPSCEKAQNPNITVEYWFPLAFVWSSIVRFRMSYEPKLGPQFELRSLRRVPDSAPCVSFALNGNITGLKDLFNRGLASPRDVSSTRGYSVLRVRPWSPPCTFDN